MLVRVVKVPSGSGEVKKYVRIVESYREQGKVKQRALDNLGAKHLLPEMLPNLARVLRGASLPQGTEGDVEFARPELGADSGCASALR